MKPVPDLHIAVFAKPLVPGQVKTRLIPSVGAGGAANIQRAMLWETLTVARDVAGEQVSLWVAGDPNDPTLHPFRDAFAPTMRTQQGHDLGARMRSAMATLLQAHSRVLLVGCDCPLLSVNNVREAAISLDDAHTDAVFIPVEDGGYVLIGLRSTLGQPQTALDAVFSEIPWSTNQVMVQTRAQLAAAGLGWAEQSTLWDMDRPEDLRRAEALGILDTPGLVTSVPGVAPTSDGPQIGRRIGIAHAGPIFDGQQGARVGLRLATHSVSFSKALFRGRTVAGNTLACLPDE